jgi:SAM-dependent methyltransferase
MSLFARDNFPWPRPPGAQQTPMWRDNAFILGHERRRILAFHTTDSHWTSELTTLHDEEAGSDHPIDRASRRLAVDSLRRFVTIERPVILDVGCSSGHVLKEIHEALPEAALVGSDYILPPLESLASKMPGLPILQFDLRGCPLEDDCVDAVTALNVLEHIDRDEDALREIRRILRPGGIAHIEVPAGPHLYDVYDKHLMHHRRYRLQELTAMARRIGFEVIKATHLGFFLYPAFVLVKKRNQRLASRNQSLDEAHQVKTHIRKSRGSALMRMLTSLETRLASKTRFPIGIRCVVVLRKP